MSEIKSTFLENIKNVIPGYIIVNDKNDKNDNQMEVDNSRNKDFNKNNSIYDSLNTKDKEEYQNSFIFIENIIPQISLEYSKSYNSVKIMVNKKLLYTSNSPNLFKIKTNEKKLKKTKKLIKNKILQ